jgi:hypothetical protein
MRIDHMKLAKKHLDRAFEEALKSILEDGQDLETALAAYPNLSEELRPRLEAALWLGKQKQNLEPRSGYLPGAAHRLVAQLSQDTPTLPIRVARSINLLLSRGRKYQWVFNSAAILLFLVMLSSVLFQVSDLSRSAIPGDEVYPIKLFLEDVHLALTLDPVRDARLQITYARRRSDEIAALIFEGRLEYLHPTVEAFRAQVSSVGYLLNKIEPARRAQVSALQADVDEMIAYQNVILGFLIQTVPDLARVDIQLAMEVSLK